MLEESLGSVHKSIHEDVRNLHIELLREDAGRELPEGGGPRAGRLRAEAGDGQGGGGGGRAQGGHLPGRGGHARRPARPRQPRPRHDQEVSTHQSNGLIICTP